MVVEPEDIPALAPLGPEHHEPDVGVLSVVQPLQGLVQVRAGQLRFDEPARHGPLAGDGRAHHGEAAVGVIGFGHGFELVVPGGEPLGSTQPGAAELLDHLVEGPAHLEPDGLLEHLEQRQLHGRLQLERKPRQLKRFGHGEGAGCILHDGRLPPPLGLEHPTQSEVLGEERQGALAPDLRLVLVVVEVTQPGLVLLAHVQAQHGRVGQLLGSRVAPVDRRIHELERQHHAVEVIRVGAPTVHNNLAYILDTCACHSHHRSSERAQKGTWLSRFGSLWYAVGTLGHAVWRLRVRSQAPFGALAQPSLSAAPLLWSP